MVHVGRKQLSIIIILCSRCDNFMEFSPTTEAVELKNILKYVKNHNSQLVNFIYFLKIIFGRKLVLLHVWLL